MIKPVSFDDESLQLTRTALAPNREACGATGGSGLDDGTVLAVTPDFGVVTVGALVVTVFGTVAEVVVVVVVDVLVVDVVEVVEVVVVELGAIRAPA